MTGKFAIAREFLAFLRDAQEMVDRAHRFLLLLIGLILVLTEGSALAPFVYSLF